jgi:hypothetical protein
MQHMKQVALALHCLADDNDGWINGINAPCNPIPTNSCNQAVDWIVLVAPYLGGGTNWNGHAKRLSVYDDATFCPGRKKSYFDSGVGQWVEGTFPYGVNTLFAGFQYTPMHSLREVVHASRIYLISDCYTGWPESCNLLVHQTLWTLDGSWGSGVWIRPRHPAKPSAAAGVREVGNGLHWVFVDGHGEFLKRTGTANWYDVEWYKYGQATIWPWTGGYNISGSEV